MSTKKNKVIVSPRVMEDFWNPMRSWIWPKGNRTQQEYCDTRVTEDDRPLTRMDYARVTEYQSQKYWLDFFDVLDDICSRDDIPPEVEGRLTDLFLIFFSKYAQIDFDAVRVRKGWGSIPEIISKQVDRFEASTNGLIRKKKVVRRIAELVSLIRWFSWNLEVGINGYPVNQPISPRYRPRKMNLRQFFVWATNRHQKVKPGKFLKWNVFSGLIRDYNGEVNLRGDEIKCSERTYRRLKKEFRLGIISKKVP